MLIFSVLTLIGTAYLFFSNIIPVSNLKIIVVIFVVILKIVDLI